MTDYKNPWDSQVDQRQSEQVSEVLLQTRNKNQNYQGNVHAILLVVHNDEFDHIVSGIKHNFEDLIITHLHSKIEGEKCMELFVIDGEAERVSTITRDFQINKKMDTVKLVTL